MPARLKIDLKTYLMERVAVDGSTGCWVWTMSANKNGYATIRNSLFEGSAHRASYEQFVGPIPTGLQLDHLCRNRRCVNPEHLECVTQQVNMARGIVGDNMRSKTHCPSGHEYGGDNLKIASDGRRHCRACKRDWGRRHYRPRPPRSHPFLSLSQEAVSSIISAASTGESQRSIAARYGVHQMTISNVVRWARARVTDQ